MAAQRKRFTCSIDGTPMAVFEEFADANRWALGSTPADAARAFDALARFPVREWRATVHGPRGILLAGYSCAQGCKPVCDLG